MREIKFRAYSKSNNKMFDNELLENAADGFYNIAKSKLLELGYYAQAEDLERGIYLPTKDKDLTFMQYTGIKDKNGKEIYEGDIVITKEGYIGLIELGIYDKNIGFNIKWITDYLRRDLGYWLSKIEVIGNIYENPELMEG